MASTDTSPEPGVRNPEPATGGAPREAPEPVAGREPARLGGRPPTRDSDGAGEETGVVRLLKDLVEDTRTLVQQELELLRLEAAGSVKRIAVDTGWIWAGAVVLTVGLICLALALALGIGALLDSYWLGALITGGVLLLVGAVLAWRGVRDLKAGGLMPGGPLQSLRENRDWARSELDELKQGITEET